MQEWRRLWEAVDRAVKPHMTDDELEELKERIERRNEAANDALPALLAECERLQAELAEARRHVEELRVWAQYALDYMQDQQRGKPETAEWNAWERQIIECRTALAAPTPVQESSLPRRKPTASLTDTDVAGTEEPIREQADAAAAIVAAAVEWAILTHRFYAGSSVAMSEVRRVDDALIAAVERWQKAQEVQP